MIYEFKCPKHGVFEQVRPMAACSIPAICPVCESPAQRIFSSPAIKFVYKKRQRLGSESEGKVILGKETGGLDIFIPSWGALEQQEVDYIAEGAIEKEKDRVKKKKKTVQRRNQALVQAYVNLANATPKGKKAKTIRQAIKETAG